MPTAMQDFITKLLGRVHLDGRLQDPACTQLYAKFTNGSYMPLVIEKLPMYDHGPGLFVSVCHFYLQNGDVMHDPEMVFSPAEDWKPLYFHQDGGLPCEDYVFVPSDKRERYRPKLAASLKSFQAQWAANLKEQGWLADGVCIDQSETTTAYAAPLTSTPAPAARPAPRQKADPAALARLRGKMNVS